MYSIEAATREDHTPLPCSGRPHDKQAIDKQPRKQFAQPQLEQLGKVADVTGFSF